MKSKSELSKKLSVFYFMLLSIITISIVMLFIYKDNFWFAWSISYSMMGLLFTIMVRYKIKKELIKNGNENRK